MTKHRFVIALIALIVLGTAAVATGADGDPVILGQEHDSETRTTFVGLVGFNVLEADTAIIGGLVATQSNLGQFGIQFDKGSPTTGIVRIPGGATQFKFRIQKAGTAPTQFVFLQVTGDDPSYRTSYEQRTIPIEKDVMRDSVITIYLNKPAPPGGLKVTYWEVAEGRQ